MADRRHAPDTTSLVLGLLLLVPAVCFLVVDTTEWSVDGRWLAPAVLIGIGLTGLLSALSSTRGSSGTTPEASSAD